MKNAAAAAVEIAAAAADAAVTAAAAAEIAAAAVAATAAVAAAVRAGNFLADSFTEAVSTAEIPLIETALFFENFFIY